jgi:hypothetical protein
MAIANALGLGGLMGNAAQQSTYVATNTSGVYQDPSRWNQEQAYRDEMIRREERARLEQRYRDEIMRYGYATQEAVKEEAPKAKQVKAVPANSFPEGYERNLLLLLEH